METSGAPKPNESGPGSLNLYAHVCPLCDMSFLREFRDGYHSIVSGYDSKKGKYWPNGKYTTNHILVYKQLISIPQEKMNEEEVDDLVAFLLGKLEEIAPFAKKEPDMEFNARKFILSYYTNKN